MNEKFFALSKEKQMNIINAGMEYFGKYGYKKALTDDITAKAGISKGLLFHYFENKKSFYMYLFDFCENLMVNYINYDEIKEIDDFFELLEYGSKKKLELMTKYPHIVRFILNAYLSQKEAVTPEINQRVQQIIERVFDEYFQFIDDTKFKDHIDIKKLYHMMIWMADGYLIDQQRMGQDFDIVKMMKEFELWMKMFKEMSYKEEYL